jgi:hypothetical protein
MLIGFAPEKGVCLKLSYPAGEARPALARLAAAFNRGEGLWPCRSGRRQGIVKLVSRKRPRTVCESQQSGQGRAESMKTGMRISAIAVAVSLGWASPALAGAKEDAAMREEQSAR